MSLFDDLKRRAASAAQNGVRKADSTAGNKTYTVTFRQLPVNLEELKAMPEAALTEPHHTAALTVAAPVCSQINVWLHSFPCRIRATQSGFVGRSHAPIR